MSGSQDVADLQKKILPQKVTNFLSKLGILKKKPKPFFYEKICDFRKLCKICNSISYFCDFMPKCPQKKYVSLGKKVSNCKISKEIFRSTFAFLPFYKNKNCDF